jgi:hypothetical protein
VEEAIGTRTDRVLALVIVLGVVLYLYAWPRNLGIADESYFLLEAKRMLGGEVLYRDIFWFAMPLAHWVMALMFGLFGTSIQTARLVMAALHGTLAVLLFLTCRRLGVRRAIAVGPPAAHVALCYPAFPYATPHWFASLLMAAILFVAIGRTRPRTPVWAMIPGTLAGALVACYQQQGTVFVLALGALPVLDEILGRRYGTRHSTGDVLRRLRQLAAGMFAVVVPVLVFMLVTAGPTSLIEQLIVHPLTGYRSFNRSDWGAVGILTHHLSRYTLPRLLKYLPLIMCIGALRGAFKWSTRTDRDGLESLTALITLCGAAVVAIAYFPDFIHIAFIAPLFFAFCAETLEAGLRRVEAVVAPPHPWGSIVAIGLLCGVALQLSTNVVRARREYPISHQTAFGRVDFSDPNDVHLLERLRVLMQNTPSRQLFVYPFYTWLYLMAGANNATPYQFVIPGFNSDAQIQGLLGILEARQVPYIVVMPMFDRPSDPIVRYIRRAYECADPGVGDGCTFYRRRQQ